MKSQKPLIKTNNVFEESFNNVNDNLNYKLSSQFINQITGN